MVRTGARSAAAKTRAFIARSKRARRTAKSPATRTSHASRPRRRSTVFAVASSSAAASGARSRALRRALNSSRVRCRTSSMPTVEPPSAFTVSRVAHSRCHLAEARVWALLPLVAPSHRCASYRDGSRGRGSSSVFVSRAHAEQPLHWRGRNAQRALLARMLFIPWLRK
jgi:hypothetical protein